MSTVETQSVDDAVRESMEAGVALPRRLSPSAVAAYRQCPRRVWFSHIAKVPRRERPSPLLVLGNAVHAALDRFYGLAPENRDEDAAHRCLRSVWKAHRTPGAFLTVEEERDWGRRGLAMLSSFVSSFDIRIRPLARERWISVRLPSGVELYGKADRLDGELGAKGPISVVDYKTGTFELDSDEMADEPQVQVYGLAAADEYGRPVERVRYLYLATGGEARWEPEAEDLDAARDKLTEQTAAMFADRTFEAWPGEHCSRCPFAHVCPDAGRVELSELDVPDDIDF